MVEDKPETPGETPDPSAVGLGGHRPLGLITPELQEKEPPPLPYTPPLMSKKKAPSTPPPVPPRLDPEVRLIILLIFLL